MLGWMSYKLESRQAGEISATNDTTLMAERERELKNFLMRVTEESERASLRLLKKLRSWHPAPL